MEQIFYGNVKSDYQTAKTRQIKLLFLSFLVGAVMFAGGMFATFGIKAAFEMMNEREVVNSENLKEVERKTPLIDLTKIDTDKDGLSDWFEMTYGLDRYNADTDFDGYKDGSELAYGYDPTGLGRYKAEIVIDKIGVKAPVVFAKSRKEADIQDAMAKGVAHYPGTSVPGAKGNIYITGHSSDFAWTKGEYKKVFRNIYKLENGDIVKININLKNGKVIEYRYKVYKKYVVPVDDKGVWFADRDGSILTLVTSWPLDTTRERMVVRGYLIE